MTLSLENNFPQAEWSDHQIRESENLGLREEYLRNRHFFSFPDTWVSGSAQYHWDRDLGESQRSPQNLGVVCVTTTFQIQIQTSDPVGGTQGSVYLALMCQTL